MTRILLIIPAYNEAGGIIDVVKHVQASIGQSGDHIDYIVVNDGSTDDTEKVLRANTIRHIELLQNLGTSGAVQTGYRYAVENGYDVAVQFDGDGQHDIRSLSTLITPIERGEADFVVGSRFVKESTSEFQSYFARRIGIRILSWLVRVLTGIRIYDITSGYRASSREVLEYFASQYSIAGSEPETYIHLYKKKFRIKEVPVNMYERLAGKSSINFWRGIRYMFRVTTAIIISSIIERK